MATTIAKRLSIGTRATDWALSIVNPRAYKVRSLMRMAESDPNLREAIGALYRAAGYKGAKSTMTSTPWIGGSASADSEISGSLSALRNRSRELARDDAVGGGLIRTFRGDVIGKGMRAQSRVKDPALRKAFEDIWYERKDTLDPVNGLTHSEHQRLVYRKLKEDGDIFLKRAISYPGEPVWFEVIEGDRVATPSEQSSDATVKDGIKKDQYSRPIGFYVSDGTPSEKMGTWHLVPAAISKHVKQIERPGQTRGVPFLHAVLQDLRDLDLLMLASLKRTQIAACLAVFIKSSRAQTIDNMMDATQNSSGYGYLADQRLEPGMMYRLFEDEEIQTLLPNFPVPELFPFIVAICRRIGAGVGVCWQTVLLDFADANYSSARTNQLKDRKTFTEEQNFFIENVLNWEWFEVMADARMRGDRRIAGASDADIKNVVWIPNGWKWVDPLKEMAAAKMGIDSGIYTESQVCGENGDDWEENQDQRIVEVIRRRVNYIAAEKAAGLEHEPWPTDPNVTYVVGNEDEKPAAKDKKPAPKEIKDEE